MKDRIFLTLLFAYSIVFSYGSFFSHHKRHLTNTQQEQQFISFKADGRDDSKIIVSDADDGIGIVDQSKSGNHDYDGTRKSELRFVISPEHVGLQRIHDDEVFVSSSDEEEGEEELQQVHDDEVFVSSSDEEEFQPILDDDDVRGLFNSIFETISYADFIRALVADIILEMLTKIIGKRDAHIGSSMRSFKFRSNNNSPPFRSASKAMTTAQDDLPHVFPFFDPTANPVFAPPPPPPIPKTDPIPIELSPKLHHPTEEFENKLYAMDGKAHDNFGNRVISNGEVIAAATKSDRLGGKVYLFKKKVSPPIPPAPAAPAAPALLSVVGNDTSSVLWVESSVLKSLGGVHDGFGEAMDISADFLVVGAPYDNTNIGCVYVFPKTGPNNFDYYHYDVLRFPDTGSFGNDVALYGHTLVVGAPGFVFDLPYLRMHQLENKGAAFVLKFDPQTSR